LSQVSSATEKNAGLSPEFSTLALPMERQRQFMWLIFGAGILSLVAAAQIIAPPASSFTVNNTASTINLAVFHFAGIGLGVFSLLIRTYTYSDRRIVAMLQSRKMQVPATLKNPFEQAVWRLFRAIWPVQLLGWAMTEGIMVVGFTAVASGNPGSAAYPFAFIALVLHALSFPRFLPTANRARKLWQEYQLGARR
jgi:hypothetical protein